MTCVFKELGKKPGFWPIDYTGRSQGSRGVRGTEWGGETGTAGGQGAFNDPVRDFGLPSQTVRSHCSFLSWDWRGFLETCIRRVLGAGQPGGADRPPGRSLGSCWGSARVGLMSSGTRGNDVFRKA